TARNNPCQVGTGGNTGNQRAPPPWAVKPPSPPGWSPASLREVCIRHGGCLVSRTFEETCHEQRLGNRRRRRSARAAEAEGRLCEASRGMPVAHGEHVGPAPGEPGVRRGGMLAALAGDQALSRPP